MNLTQLSAWLSPDRILALIAIVAGVVAVVYETKLHNGFKEQHSKIEQIVLSVHTAYVGRFPENLDRLANLIANLREDEELLILVDFLGYGHYSAPEKYDRYVKAMLNSKSKIRMLIYGEDSAKATITAQFQGDFASISKTDTFRAYLLYYKNVITKTPTNINELKNALVQTQDYFALQLTGKNNIDVRAIPSPSSHEAVFYWLGKDEMVFAFPSLYDVEKGFSFKTRDDHLMEAFRTQFERKWIGKPVLKQCYSKDTLF
jgi:hypothetical protein